MTMNGMKIDEAITLLIEIRNDYFRQGTSRFDAMSAGIAALTEVATKKPVDGSDVRLINANTLKHRRGIAGDEILHKIIDTEPTIEAVPVRHGHWVATGFVDDAGRREYACSECKSPVYVFDSKLPMFMVHEPYCAGCGADMRAPNF